MKTRLLMLMILILSMLTVCASAGQHIDLTGPSFLKLEDGTNSYIELADGVQLLDLRDQNNSLNVSRLSGETSTLSLQGLTAVQQQTVQETPAGTWIFLLDDSTTGDPAMYAVRKNGNTLQDGRLLLSGAQVDSGEDTMTSLYSDVSFKISRDFSETVQPLDNLTASLEASVQGIFSVSFRWNGKSSLYGTEAKSNVNIAYEAEVKGSFHSASLEYAFPLAKIPTGAGIPYIADIEAVLSIPVAIEASGEVEYEFTGGELEMEMQVKDGKLYFYPPRVASPTPSCKNLTIEGDASIGITAGPQGVLASIFEIGGSCGYLVHFIGKLEKNPFLDDGMKRHVCEELKCLGIEASSKIEWGLSVGYGIVSKTLFHGDIIDFGPFAHFYHSFTFDDGGATECPYHGYRLKVKAVDQDTGNPLSNATVNVVTNATILDPFKQAFTATTGHDGYATVYIPLNLFTVPTSPLTVDIQAEYPIQQAWKGKSTKPFTEKGYVLGPDGKPLLDQETKLPSLQDPELVIPIDTRIFTVRFLDPGSGTIRNLPIPLQLYRGDGENGVCRLKLPDNIPEKSGMVFMGWSDDPLASPDSDLYTPGETIRITDDTDLYAIFRVNQGSSCMVVYHPNGGDSAPRAELFDSSPFTITTEEAVWEGFGFLGWSLDSNALEPDIHPGDTLSMDIDQTVILYAVWKINSVVPVTVRYHPNGDSQTTMPKNQVSLSTVAVAIPDLIPEWDPQHGFLGWDCDPDAEKPHYFPGYSYRFDADTDLYAIWVRDYRILEGDGAVWQADRTDGLRFLANGQLKYCTGIKVDGKLIPEENYELSSGSTIVELKPAYLSSLTEWEHHIQVVYQDGETPKAAFLIAALPDLPITGDGSGFPMMMFLLASGVLLLLRHRRNA